MRATHVPYELSALRPTCVTMPSTHEALSLRCLTATENSPKSLLTRTSSLTSCFPSAPSKAARSQAGRQFHMWITLACMHAWMNTNILTYSYPKKMRA